MILICKICGKEFDAIRKSQRYCCEACAYTGRRLIDEAYRMKHGQKKIPERRASFESKANILRTKEHKAWSENYRRRPKDHKKLDRTLAECKKQGIDYAEKQKQESIRMFAKVRVE